MTFVKNSSDDDDDDDDFEPEIVRPKQAPRKAFDNRKGMLREDRVIINKNEEINVPHL